MNFPIGYNTQSFNKTRYDIDPNRHTLVIGKSGTGKSTLLVNKAQWHIAEGDGLLFIDPHGDAVMELERQIPSWRLEDVVVMNPLSRNVLGLNPFSYIEEDQRHLSVESFLTMTKNLAGPHGWGDETEFVLNIAAQVVIEFVPNPTIIDIYRFIVRPAFRKRLAEATGDGRILDFIKKYDDDLRPSERMAKFAPPLNKVDKYLRPLVRTMLCQRSCFPFLDAMNSRKIILVDLSKGRLGDFASRILGSVILSHVAIAALRRTSERTQFHVMVDEVHNFTYAIDLPTFVSQLRKYGIDATFATQSREQLPSCKEVVGSVSNMIVYRSSGEDSDAMAQEMGSPTMNEAITNLPDRQAFALTIRNRKPVLGPQLEMMPPFTRQEDRIPRRTLLTVSRRKYGMNRKELDPVILKELAR